MAKIHREGLTLLSESVGASGNRHDLNIIFVHGLRGHPRGTWSDPQPTLMTGCNEDTDARTDKNIKTFFGLKKSKRQTSTSPPSDILWPEEYLAPDLPQARIWTYGYNADVIGGLFQANNQNSVSQHGRDFAVRLERDIDNEDPIVFVAHSLGGIITKDALHKSETICKRTKLIVFLGTPHRGSTYAGWGEIASNLASLAMHDSNKRLVQALEVNGEVLDNIHEEFKTILSKCAIKVHSFQEAKGISGMKGLDSKVVDNFSSKLDLAREQETVETIDANHMEMARCSSRDDVCYRQICGVLKQFIRNGMSSRETNSADNNDRSLRATNETSSERSRPLRVLPFGRNRDFVGRQSQLHQLITILHTEDAAEDCQRAALVGLGGVGKTQIALECAFQLQSASPTCSVFWVRASDATSFDNAYRDIGQQLKIPGFENDKADVKRLVKTHLSQESTGKWLMIVDNADDFEMFYNGNDDNGSGALSLYLPFSTLGAILFTTRDREAATRYAGSNVFDIDEMDDSESRELLQRSLQNKHLMEDKDSITTLLKSLINLPLAIMQAAAYLNAKGSTIAEYLRIYEDSSDNVIRLLSKDFEDRRRYPGMKNPIATTWLISFKQIQVRDPLAAEYMAFMSCVNEQDIPRDLLPPASEFDKSEALDTLKSFGFIKERFGAASYDIHRLVHIAMQNWLKLKNERRSWNEKTLNQITGAFPWPQHENRAVWMMYLSHAQCVIASFETKDLPWDLLHSLGQCSHLQGKHAEAEAMQRRTLKLMETTLGKYHPNTLISKMSLAVSLNQQGKYVEAEAMHRQTLQLREMVLGKDHPNTLISMGNIAESLRQQGKYAEAEVMQRQTLQRMETVLKKDHPDRLSSMMGLAVSLQQQGKYAEAEAMHGQTLQLRETVLGKGHPDTLSSMMNLAVSLHQQGKYAEAESMHRQTLQLWKTVLGKGHPDMLASTGNLAVSLHQQGKYAEAIAMHPDTLRSMNGLAESLQEQRKFAEAEAMNRQTLQLREMVLGKDHLDTLSSRSNLVQSLLPQGKHAEAYNAMHPDTLRSMNGVTKLLRHREKYAEAEAMQRLKLQLQETVLGKNRPHMLASMMDLAVSLHQQGKYAEAESMHRQTLQLWETVLGNNHPDTLKNMSNLAASLHQQGKYAEAEAMGRQTLQLHETVLGKDHPDTLKSMSNLAASLHQQGKYAEAEAMGRQTLQLHETLLGKDHPDTLKNMSNLAVSLHQQGKYAEAEAMHWQTLQLQETVLGKDHPDILASMGNLAIYHL